MRKWMNKLNTKVGTGKLIAFVAVCLVAVLLVGVSIAWFTSQINLTGSTFATGTLEFKAYGYNSDGDLVTTIYPEGKIPEGDSTANAPLFSDKDMRAGSVSTAFIAIENSGTLNLEYRLSFSVSEHLDSTNDDLVYLGGYWYQLTDVTPLVTSDIKTFAGANKAVPCNSTNCTTSSHTCTEKNGSQNLSTISKYSNKGIINAGSGTVHYYRLDYGVRADASINEYANRKFAVTASVFTSQVGALDEEAGFGVTRQVGSAEELDRALEQALPGDTILLLNNVTYNGDLIIKKCINFEAGGKTLTVNGNMIYDFVSTLPLEINLQGKGTIKVVASGAVGGNFTISAPKSQVELIGGNTAGDLLVGRLFTVDATNDSDSGGCIFSDIVILDGDGKDAKAVYVRSNTKLTVSSGVTLERIEATVQATNIEIQNAGQINQVLLSSMFQTTQTDAPQIYIHNYNRIFNIVLPTWSVPFVDDGNGNYSGNTRIVVSAGGVIDTLTGSANFNSSNIEDEDANLYVEQIVTGFDTGLRVYYRNLPDQTNTTLYDILTYYFMTEKGMTSAQMTTAVNAIEKLEIICRGTKTVTATDFSKIRGMASIASLDLSQSSIANNTIPSKALQDVTTITEVLLPRNITKIDTYAFSGTSIKKITIPATVTSITNSALANIPYVYMLSYEPSNITDSGHYGCYFFVPDSVVDQYRTTGNWAEFTDNQTDIGKIYPTAQLADDGFTHVRKMGDGSYEIVLYVGSSENLVVGDNVVVDGNTVSVSAVGRDAYAHLKQSYTLKFNPSVKTVGNNAFRVTRVTGIIDFSSIDTIGDHAFRNCDYITQILDGNKIKAIGAQAFYGCDRLYQVILPEIQTVGTSAFALNTSLISISFGEDLLSLSSGQFENSLLLREITIKAPATEELVIDKLYTKINSNIRPTIRVFVPADCITDYVTKFGTDYAHTLCEDGEIKGVHKIAVYYSNAHIGDIDLGLFRVRDMGNNEVSITSCNVFESDISDQSFWSSFDAVPSTLDGKSVVRIGPAAYRGVPFSLMTKATDATLNPWGNNNVYFPDTVKTVGDYAFYKSDVTFTSMTSVNTVGAHAFESTTRLYYVNAPELLTMGANAFDSATGIRHFSAEKLTSLGERAFYMCTNLIRVHVPSLTSIPSSCFTSASNLSELKIALYVSSLSGTVPTHSSNGKAIVLTGNANTNRKQYLNGDVMPANVSNHPITDDNGNVLCVLDNMPEYWVIENTTDDEENTVTIVNYFAKSAHTSTINLPGSLQVKVNDANVVMKVVSLGRYAFVGASFGNNTIVFPSTITEIDKYVFWNIKSFSGPVNLNNVQSVGAYSFYGTGVTSVVAPKVITVQGNAFESCTLLKSISFPKATSIKGKAFSGCTLLESAYFEDVTAFEANAFASNYKLVNITINREITSSSELPSWGTKYAYGTSSTSYKIELYVPTASVALYKASTSYKSYPVHALDTVMTNSDGNYTMVERADGWEIIKFNPTDAITTLTVPATHDGKNIIYISPNAFSLCTTVTTIVLPVNYCHYQQGAFNGMTALQNVNVASGSAYFSSASGVLFSANGKELVYYPSGNTRTSYTVPSGTELIQSYAFDGATMLQTLVVPAGVTTVGYQAFNNSGLNSITFAGTTPPYMVDTDIFNTNVDGFTIYVPAGSGNAYKASSGFIKYKDYIVEG